MDHLGMTKHDPYYFASPPSSNGFLTAIGRSRSCCSLFVLAFSALMLWPSCGPVDPPPPSMIDTTSHAFTWSITTLGDGGNCNLRDVLIASDSVAIATGKVNLRDSLQGGLVVTYNFLTWNGLAWRGGRIEFFTVCGQQDRTVYPAQSCLAFGPTDVWITMLGDEIARWNGTQQTMTSCYSVIYGTLWGKSPTSVYSVGYNGGIAYYNGSSWQGFSSGLGISLVDVHGSPTGNSVWACGFSDKQPDNHLLRIDGTSASLVFDGAPSRFVIKNDSLSGALTSVYAPADDKFFVASNAGVYEASPSTHGEAKRIALDNTWFPGLPHKIRGNGANDWFVVGNFGFVAHYNGSTLYHYPELMKDTYVLYSVAQRGNLVIAVGYDYDPFDSKALVIVGRR